MTADTAHSQSSILTALSNLRQHLEELHLVLQIGQAQATRRLGEATQIKNAVEAAGQFVALPPEVQASTLRANLNEDRGTLEDLQGIVASLKAGIRPAADKLHRMEVFLRKCAAPAPAQL